MLMILKVQTMLVYAHYCFLHAMYSPFSKIWALLMHRCAPQTNSAFPAFHPGTWLQWGLLVWHRAVSGMCNTLLHFFRPSSDPCALTPCRVLVTSILLLLSLRSTRDSVCAGSNSPPAVFGNYVGIRG